MAEESKDGPSLVSAVRRIDAERLKRVLKQTPESMAEMSKENLLLLIEQAEIDMKRCYQGADNLRIAGGMVADVYVSALEAAEKRGVRLR